MIGYYIPGDSFIHRAPAGFKLFFLAAMGLASFSLDIGVYFGIFMILAVLMCWIVGLDWRTLKRILKPVALVLLAIFLAHLFVGDFFSAIAAVIRILTVILFATLVTVSTHMDDMIEVFKLVARPLEPFGVKPRKLAFLLSLTIRLIPAIFEILAEVREAQKSRGLERSVFAVIVPFMVRALKKADALGDALTSRRFEES